MPLELWCLSIQCLLFFCSSVENVSKPVQDSEMAEQGGERVTESTHNLWVDKYAPRHYTHLLSDDVSTVHAKKVSTTAPYYCNIVCGASTAYLLPLCSTA